MEKNLPDWAYRVLSVVGIVLVCSMVLNWIDIGHHSRTGLGLAWDDNHWLFLVPLTGGVLVAAASAKSGWTRLAAIAAGVVVAGDVLFNVANGIFHSGLDTWLVLGGAGVILAGAKKDRQHLRVAGGLAVIAGFVAPWDSDSMFRVLVRSDVDLFSVRLMWLIPGAALASIALASHPQGGKVAAATGIGIYGLFLYGILSVLNLFFGWGAWVALGASSLALILGVLAPAALARAIPQPKPSPTDE